LPGLLTSHKDRKPSTESRRMTRPRAHLLLLSSFLAALAAACSMLGAREIVFENVE
jgi:hypothetical protein